MSNFTISAVLSMLFVALIVASPPTTGVQYKLLEKRGIPLWGDEISTFPASGFAGIKYSPGYPLAPWANPSRAVGPSPSEVANAISQAKQASANVLIAQQQVQAAKDNVLHQQKVAMDKETTATLLTQKSEAAAAIQRSEAAAAAQSVVLAQQRLAAAKSAVAHQQRIAAAKEAEAAAALQNSARAAAVEIQRTEQEATKFANLHRAGVAASAHHLSATKDAALAPLTAGTNHIPNLNTLSWPITQYSFVGGNDGGNGHGNNPWANGIAWIPANSSPIFGSKQTLPW